MKTETVSRGSRRAPSSLSLQFLSLIGLTALLVFAALWSLASGAYRRQLRREATTLAGHVVAFRRWIAASGVVWVDHLSPPFKDYLMKVRAEKGWYYAKNPALATRELSTIHADEQKRSRFRVTSDNYRRAENRPDAFEAWAIRRFKASSAPPFVERYAGGTYRFAKPLKVVKACLRCHGRPDDAPSPLLARYGRKRAFGYGVGDIRGVISIKLERRRLINTLSGFEPVVLVSIAAIVLLFLLCYLWFRRSVSAPLSRLLQGTRAVAAGNYDAMIHTLRRGSTRPTEVGELERAFVEMSSELRRTTVKRERLDQIFHCTGESLIVLSPTHTIEEVNHATCTLLDHEASALIGQPFSAIADLNEIVVEEGQTPRSRRPDRAAYRRRGGESVPVIFSSGAMIEGDSLTGYICSAWDLRHQLEAERALQGSEDRFRAMVASVGDAVILADEQGSIVHWNQAAVKMFGYSSEEIIGRPLIELIPQPLRSAHRLAFDAFVKKGGRSRPQARPTVELFGLKKTGETFPIAPTLAGWREGETMVMSAIIRDLSEHRAAARERAALQAQLERSRRLESIGRLAGGVAHDFNNQLMVILSSASLAREGLREGDPLLEDLADIEHAANRSSALTRQLLAFSSRQVLHPEILDLNAVITRLQKLIGRLIGETIALGAKLDPDLGCVKVDPAQVEQILMNLAINARDAMPEGGTLTIETSSISFDGDRLPPGRAAGPYVRLAVRDDGCGMDSQTRDQALEPFFTTKERGKGTGLGLSTVFGIVAQSGGWLRIDSEFGEGTTVEVFLPRVDGSPGQAAATGQPKALRGAETILVVEDEDAVRRLATRALERAGYRVLQARDGLEAQVVVEQSESPIDLLITDVVMPKLGGPATARAIRAKNSKLKVIFITGYSEEVVSNGPLADEVALLLKPFMPSALLEAVREALDAEK